MPAYLRATLTLLRIWARLLPMIFFLSAKNAERESSIYTGLSWNMRFVSLEASRKRKKRRKAILIFLVILFGVFFAAESRYAFFRIRNIEVAPPDILSQRDVWGSLSEYQEKYWPILWLTKEQQCRLISQYHPMDAKISLNGWGLFSLECTPLIPVIQMYWGSKYWYVSSDGRVWLTSLNQPGTSSRRVPSLPILYWSSDRTSPVDVARGSGNVYLSSLPIAKIMKWYSNIESFGWTKHVKYIQAIMRDGRPVVRVVFIPHSQDSYLEIIFSDDPAEWRDIGAAIKKIFTNLAEMPKKIFIDATYKDKIIVKNKVQ